MARKAASKPARPAKPAAPDVNVVSQEFQDALKAAGINPQRPGSAGGGNLPAFLKVVAEFIAKYGPAILPLLQMIFQAMSHAPADAPTPGGDSDELI